MRRTPASHNLSLIRLITFASVIGTQCHTLSISVATPHIDEPNRPTNPTADFTRAATSTSSLSSTSSMSASLSMSTTTTALYESRTPRITSSPGSVSSSSSSTTTIMTTQGASSSSAASSANSAMKSTSRFPLEFSSSKNTWSKADGAAAGAHLPAASTTADAERARTFRSKHHHEHHWGPFFEEPLNSTMPGDNLVSTAHLYTEAVLNCRVGMLKDKTVMWVRRTTEKVSLLTVGNVTYSGDPRIRVKFQYPNNWRLLINPTQTKDAGVYMCQVSTHPPRVFTTNLTILEPPLRLIDDQEREVSDRYYKSGSTIDLQCQVSRSFLYKERLSILKSIQHSDQSKTNTNRAAVATSAKALELEIVDVNPGRGNQSAKAWSVEKQVNSFIFWTKDDEELPVATVARSSATEKWLCSRISIPDAKLADSGNYSCSIGKLFRAIVQVQVLTGELPAAVQHNAAPTTHLRLHPLLLSWICVIAAFQLFSRNISPSTRSGTTRIHRSYYYCAHKISFN